MNKQRERLVELIGQTVEDPSLTCPHMGTSEGCEGCKYLKDDSCDTAGRLADHLLSKGIIVPPCKVGDTAYVISRYYGGEWKIFECKINDITIYESNMFIALHSVNNFCFAENAEQIGKTVFLTKEEAEKALNNVQNGNSCEGGAE